MGLHRAGDVLLLDLSDGYMALFCGKSYTVTSLFFTLFWMYISQLFSPECLRQKKKCRPRHLRHWQVPKEACILVFL